MEKIRRPVAQERSDDQFERQAKERNSYRTLFEKVMGANKTSSDDVLREQADRVNDLVDRKIENEKGGSTQAAADEILESTEFAIGNSEQYASIPTARREMHQGRVRESAGTLNIKDMSYERAQDHLEFKEFLNSQDPVLETSIEAGVIQPAVKFIREAQSRMDTYEQRALFSGGLRDMIANKVDTMIKAHDVGAMENLIMNMDPELAGWVSVGDIARMPMELLSRPDIRPKAIWLLKQNITLNRGNADAVLEQLEKMETKES